MTICAFYCFHCMPVFQIVFSREKPLGNLKQVCACLEYGEGMTLYLFHVDFDKDLKSSLEVIDCGFVCRN